MLLNVLLFPAAFSICVMHVDAEPLRQREPYQPQVARMSVRNLLGLQSRQDGAYNPDQQFCGQGDTCAEACGEGFAKCPSRDGFTHCFHRSAKQTCCPNLSGEACDEGFYCAADEKAKTWCCPDELGLKECANKFNLDTLTTPTPSSSLEKPTSTKKSGDTTVSPGKGESPPATTTATTTAGSSEESPDGEPKAGETADDTTDSEPTATPEPTAASNDDAPETTPGASSEPIPAPTDSVKVNAASALDAVSRTTLLLGAATFLKTLLQ